MITSTGNGAAKVLDGVKIVRIDAAQILLDLLGDHAFLSLDRARREDLVEQAAHVAVPGRVHEDDHLRPGLRRQFAFPHRFQVDTVGRRVRLEVLERRCDVFVPGQRVEVVLLAVVDRRFLAHSAVRLVGPVEEVLGKRIENQFCLGHCILLRVEVMTGVPS